jgi:hypothetical protein
VFAGLVYWYQREEETSLYTRAAILACLALFLALS